MVIGEIADPETMAVYDSKRSMDWPSGFQLSVLSCRPPLLLYELRRGFGRTGVAGVKGLRRDPERDKIDGFGNFIALWVEAALTQ